ncbi:hypothetical protein AB6A40_001674 [Gnathostoma spinigerum]|uniref:Uncharacterized protein n=1 Tax=Gnathostoma spinigerum TaxID=75299 RepID=A0ABD6E5Q8_9BILA
MCTAQTIDCFLLKLIFDIYFIRFCHGDATPAAVSNVSNKSINNQIGSSLNELTTATLRRRRYQPLSVNICPPGWVLNEDRFYTSCTTNPNAACDDASSCTAQPIFQMQHPCCYSAVTNQLLPVLRYQNDIKCVSHKHIPELLPDNQPRLCSHLSPACSKGYVCQESVTIGVMICCPQSLPQNIRFSCPFNGQRAALQGYDNIFCATPNQQGICPSGSLCYPASAAPEINICCYSELPSLVFATPKCPDGRRPQLDELGKYVACNAHSSIQPCANGFSCSRSVTNPSIILCCSNGSEMECPNGGEPLMESGSAKKCTLNDPLSCPTKYECVQRTGNTTKYVCCSTNARSRCPRNFIPALGPTGREVFCTPNNPQICPSDSNCFQSLSQTDMYLCCRSEQSPLICRNSREALRTSTGEIQQCSGPGASCPRDGYACTISITMRSWVCCEDENLTLLCINGQQPYRGNQGVVLQCGGTNTNVCPIGYKCISSTDANRWVCCMDSPPISSSLPPPITETPSSISMTCPSGWNSYRSHKDGKYRYCQSSIDMK